MQHLLMYFSPSGYNITWNRKKYYIREFGSKNWLRNAIIIHKYISSTKCLAKKLRRIDIFALNEVNY